MNDDRTGNARPRYTWLERLRRRVSDAPRDRDQLVDLLREAQRRNLLDADALGMIEAVLQVSEMQVRDIMIPRAQMVVVERDEAPENILPRIIDSGHSRFPVIGGNRDEVIGILLAKDMLRHFVGNSRHAFSLRDTLRPAVFIPESKRLNMLLKEFRASRNHMAIVVDEYSGVAGLVTIEDVLEQIVGDIGDEHDVDEARFILKHSESSYTVKALTPIEDFNEFFDARLSDEEFDTIGGLVTNAFGYLPRRGESITLGDYRFQVLRADNRRVHLLHVTPLPAPAPASE